MPRKFSVMPVSIWRDDSFTSLGRGAQWLYLMLLSQRQLTPAGILPTLPRRWAGMTSSLGGDEVVAWLDELQAAGWAYTDHQALETFVSGYFEGEQIARQPRRVIAALDAIPQIEPEWLRALVSAELGDLVAAAPLPKAPRGIRAKILERDCHRCRKCGWMPGDAVPVKKGTDRPVFRTLEIDHIWPRSRGGANEEANFQVLCTTCNCKKGARLDSAQLSTMRG